MTDQELEQAFDGSYHLKGYTPAKTSEVAEAEETQKQLLTMQSRILKIKDELLTAVFLDDTETVDSLKAEYKKLIDG